MGKDFPAEENSCWSGHDVSEHDVLVELHLL